MLDNGLNDITAWTMGATRIPMRLFAIAKLDEKEGLVIVGNEARASSLCTRNEYKQAAVQEIRTTVSAKTKDGFEDDKSQQLFLMLCEQMSWEEAQSVVSYCEMRGRQAQGRRFLQARSRKNNIKNSNHVLLKDLRDSIRNQDELYPDEENLAILTDDLPEENKRGNKSRQRYVPDMKAGARKYSPISSDIPDEISKHKADMQRERTQKDRYSLISDRGTTLFRDLTFTECRILNACFPVLLRKAQ
jgi:hypothetical protein